ncbi:glutaredoxin [Irpex rosettiformis]|uniref:Glutaredoxin n=1 Tax=Irpex rosettiformis TaxID=378272 RepID=A0ACB8U7I2_9APHY|nr:glutaredoxin [Irpex rosettiformis]
MSNPPNAIAVTSPEHFQSVLSQDLQRISLINFWAPWAAPCTQMNEFVLELAKKYPQLLVLSVDAEQQEDISESFNIESVPTFVILQGHTLLGRVAGADAATLADVIAKHTRTPSTVNPQSHTEKAPAAPIDTSADKAESEAQLDERCRGIMAQSRVVLFMKGEPDAPRCGFSRKIVALLRDQGVDFTHFDILKDESVRARLKTLNDWPTFPQLIVSGEFVGGLDIVQEMVENGEFDEVVKLHA